MKNSLFILMTVLVSLNVIAQTDSCLIVKEFGPNTWEVIRSKYFDMNDDGEWDFKFYKDVSSTMMAYPVVSPREKACFHAVDSNQFHGQITNYFVDLNTPLNDESLNYGVRIESDKNWIGHYRLDTLRYKAALRFGQEGEYYYGWMEAYSVVTYYYDTVWFYLARTCYCTIPNYPLKWGQTTLHDAIDESNDNEFFSISPVPSTGVFFVTGENLKHIDIFDALGKQVASLSTQGNQTSIDLSQQPAGIYFVNVTDNNGRKHAKKIIKQ